MTQDFPWPPDTWHTLKLRVENLPGGAVKVQGKSWKTGTPEPTAWMVERIDPHGTRTGAPGFFLDAEFGALIDNVKVVPNRPATAGVSR